MTIQEKLNTTQVYIFSALASQDAEQDGTAMDVLTMIYQQHTAYSCHKAREAGKGSNLYEEVKTYKTPSVRWGFYDSKKNQEHGQKVSNPTGLMYIDIDPQDLEGIDLSEHTIHNNETLKKLYALPYVCAMWKSFGGEGLGVLCSVDSYTNNTYAEHYHDISAHIFTNTGIMPDPACANPDRLNVISNDDQLVLKAGECTPYAVRSYTNYSSDPSNNVFKKFNNSPESDGILEQALTGQGWRKGKGDQWTRPGKGAGVSALWSKSGPYEGKIRIFTSSTDLEPKMYDKAELVKELQYSGDSKQFVKYLYTLFPNNTKIQPSSPSGSPVQRAGTYTPATDEPDEIDLLIESIDLPGKVQIMDMQESFGCFDVFPDQIANILESFCVGSNAPREFVMPSALFAISVMTMGKVWINVNAHQGYRESPVFWGMILGKPGESKTYPAKSCINHILDNIELQLNSDYENELEKFDTIQEMKAQDKKEALSMDPHLTKPPIRRQILGTSGTMEGYIQTLKHTGTTGRFADEIRGLFGSLNAHKSGGGGDDTENYLQIFNRSTIQKNLVRETLYIRAPFMPIFGTGVTEIMVKELKKGHTNTGMYERWTYWMKPQLKEGEEIKKRSIRSRLLQQATGEADGKMAMIRWSKFIDKMFHFFKSYNSDTPLVLNYDEAATKQVEMWESWFFDQEHEFAKKGNNGMISMYAKIKIHFYRLPALFWAARIFGTDINAQHDYTSVLDTTIRVEDILAAQNIINYLITTYTYMHEELFSVHDPNTLDKSEVSDYRRSLVKKLRTKHPDASYRTIAEAVNRLTPSSKGVTHVTVGNWIRKF